MPNFYKFTVYIPHIENQGLHNTFHYKQKEHVLILPYKEIRIYLVVGHHQEKEYKVKYRGYVTK